MTNEISPGIHDITNEQYHASPGISRSGIALFRKSPLHFWHRYVNPNYAPEKPTEAMLLGEALHTLILEPQEFENRCYIYTDIDRRTKEGKRLWEAIITGNEGKISLHSDQYATLKNMKSAIDANQMASKLIAKAEYERSVYWIDEGSALLCKCRPDVWANNYIADLKTTNDGSYNAFQRAIFTYNYDIQMAMIREGVKHATGEVINDFIFIVVEKEAPYAVSVYPLDKAWVDEGEFKFKEILQQMKTCIASNNWPGYPVQSMCMPGWANG